MRRRVKTIIFASLLLSLAGGVFLLFFIFFGFQAAIYLLSVESEEEAPALYVVPQEREVGVGRDVPGTKIESFGYSFEVPWVGVEKKWEREDAVTYYFENGRGVLFDSPDRLVPFYGSMNAKLPQEKKGLVFGGSAEEYINSEYSMFRAFLRLTPADLGLFTPRDRAFRTCLLLSFKRAYVTESANRIYHFCRGALKGIQFGSPPESRFIEIGLFPEDDVHVPVHLFMMEGKEGELSVEDIDHVILSFRRSDR